MRSFSLISVLLTALFLISSFGGLIGPVSAQESIVSSTITANLTADKTTIFENQAVRFSGSFYDTDLCVGYPISWTGFIDFGDRSAPYAFSIKGNPTPIGPVSKTYGFVSGTKTYKAVMSIYRHCGNTIEPQPVYSNSVVITVKNNAPTVKISPATVTIYQKNSVKFTAKVSGGNIPYKYAWAGNCGGTSTTSTAYFPNPGTYYCAVTVTDVDGDKAKASAKITVLKKASIPPYDGGGNTNPPSDTVGLVATKVTAEESEDVLGTQTCSVQSNISGFVFEDSNKDGSKSDNENGIEKIKIDVYWKNNEQYELLDTIMTDASGYWMTEVCPGEYRLSLNTSVLPDGYVSAGATELEQTVEEEKDVENINFALELVKEDKDEKTGFNWLWVIIPLGVLLLGLGIYAGTKNKDEQVQF